MNISDYIPDYPDLTKPNFNNQIFHKKEFYDLRTTSKQVTTSPGDPWPHQELISRFLSPYTPYSKQLLFHTPGTGKTCAAAIVAEINKPDPLSRKPYLIIVPNDNLAVQWKQQIALVCTKGDYIPDKYFETDPVAKLTDLEKTSRMDKLLRPIYEIITMERMSRMIDKASDQYLYKAYSNSIIIIDEAHNLRIQTGKKKSKVTQGRYKAYHRFLHLVENTKVLLLSGTPMFDQVGELPTLMNLILPVDKQLPVKQNFTKEFLTTTGEIRTFKNETKLRNSLVGMVSYIREGGSFPTRQDLGDTKWTKFIKTVNLKMSQTQLTGYLEAYKRDKTTEKTQEKKRADIGLWKNSRQASVFVFQTPEGKYLWGTEASELLVVKQRVKTITVKGHPVTIVPTMINNKYAETIKTNLDKWSSKYNFIIKHLQKFAGQPTFIFTPLVSGTGGAIFLGLILQLFGYSKAQGNEINPGKRYAIITGDTKSSLQRRSLIEIFNSPNNTKGELIEVMIASKTISEGTSFKNGQHAIVVSPYWNNSGTEQAIGRVLRADSLKGLPTAKRKVTVQQLAIDGPKEAENIDAYMYKISQKKDFEIKAAERILKTVAWDCALNYDRNVRDNDRDKSRSCDYQKCNYSCYQVPPDTTNKKWTYLLPESALDQNTYLLYYSQPALLKTIEKIKQLLRKHSYINIQNLGKLLETEDLKVVILAIEYMIENHETVYNKWGQAVFLRNEGNMLFLSNTPTERTLMASWYTRYPYANQVVPLAQLVESQILTTELGKLDCKNLTLNRAKQMIDSMPLEAKIILLEQLLLIPTAGLKNVQKKNYDLLRKVFKPHIFQKTMTDTGIEMIFHNLEKTKLAADYIDFTKGEGGQLRCLRDGYWNYCGKKETEQLVDVISQAQAEVFKEITKEEVYAILTTDDKFQIVDRSKDPSEKDDLRTKSTGQVCKTWKKWKLIELYLRLAIDAPGTLVANTNKKSLEEIIKKKKLQEAIPKKATVKQLQLIVTLADTTTAIICDHLKKWFEERKLIVRQA
jgi:superfamily II DNA or RNA helicase